MHMRVTRSRFDPSRIDESNKVTPELVAAVRRQPGCQSYVIGVDRASGRTVAMSTWDTEEHAQLAPDALGDVMPTLQALGLQMDPTETFEVVS